MKRTVEYTYLLSVEDVKEAIQLYLEYKNVKEIDVISDLEVVNRKEYYSVGMFDEDCHEIFDGFKVKVIQEST